MSATVSIAGHLLGKVYTRRTTPGGDAVSLDCSLDSAARLLDIITPGSGTEPPKIGDRGKGLVQFSLQTRRDFSSASKAFAWVLDLAEERGYAGEVKFQLSDGGERSFTYGVALPGGTQQTGSSVAVRWQITIGRKLE